MGTGTQTRLGLLFLLLALLARLPLTRLTLCGEEGEVGRAVVDVLKGQRPMLVIARDLKGREYTTPPSHNAGGYALPALVFLPAALVLRSTSAADWARGGIALRCTYLLLFAGALLFALYLVPRERRAIGGLLLAGFSLFSLPLFASVQVQYDGAVSTLLLCSVVYLLDRDRPRGNAARWLRRGSPLRSTQRTFAAGTR